MKNICRSIDTALADTHFDETDRRAVWNKLDENRRPPLRSPLRVVILVVLLLALFATALAVSLSRAYFEDVAALQSQSGYYDDWSLDEKLHFFQVMIQHGAVPETPELAAILRDPMADDAREAAMDAFAAGRYGIDGRTDVIGLESILIKEKGELRYWSLEDMAWYTQLHQDHGILGSDVCLMSVPGKDVIQPDEAVAIAKAAVMDAFCLPPGALDDHRPLLEYSIHLSMAEQYDPFYNVTFEGHPYYYCGVDNDGRIMTSATHPQYFGLSPYEEAAMEQQTAEASAKHSAEMEKRREDLEALHGPMALWSADVFHQWAPDYYLTPEKDEISFEAACDAAKKVLQEKHPEFYTVDQLHQLAINGFLLKGEFHDEDNRWHNYYYLAFDRQPTDLPADITRHIAFVCIDAFNGEVINVEDYSDPTENGGNG